MRVESRELFCFVIIYPPIIVNCKCSEHVSNLNKYVVDILCAFDYDKYKIMILNYYVEISTHFFATLRAVFIDNHDCSAWTGCMKGV